MMDRNASPPAVIQVPLAYEATGRYANGRRERTTMWLREDVPVPVAVVPPSDAPVALRIQQPAPASRSKASPAPQPVEIRWDGTRLLRPLLGPRGNALDPKALAREFAKPHPDDLVWPHNPFLDYGTGVGGGRMSRNVFLMFRPEELAERFAGWEGNDRDDRLAALLARASDVALVDGVLHRACPEPVVEVRVGTQWAVSKDWTAGVVLDEPVPTLEAVRFRLDRLADAMDFMDRPGSTRGLSGSFEVLIPEAIRRDALELNARSLFGPAALHLHALLPQLDGSGVARAWADLRDAEVAWRSGDPDAIREGYAALRRIADGDWTRSPTSQYASYGYTPAFDLPRPLLEAYERFEMDRTLDEGILAGFAPA